MVSRVAERPVQVEQPGVTAPEAGQRYRPEGLPANFGPYTILELIDKGGMATVYRAYHAALDREVAIKVLPPYFAEHDGYRAQFAQEAETTARFQHRNVVTVYDRGHWMGQPYLVMEYVTGGTLSRRLRRPMGADEAVKILGPIADALDYVHEEGTLHRDVKPSNVLIRPDGTPVLADFGLSEPVKSRQLPGVGSFMGTPEYMAPERCCAAEQGPSADLYSLAVMAYEMLAGRLPFDAPTPEGLLMAHAYDELPRPRLRNPAISVPVEGVLLKALAKLPEDRYATGREFVAALEAAIAPRDMVAEDVALAGAGAGTRGLQRIVDWFRAA
jgi:serine/threonine-protein kinase